MILCPSVLGDDAKTFVIWVGDKNSLNLPEVKVYLDGLNDNNYVGITNSRGEVHVPVGFGKHAIFAISACGSASKEYNFSDNIDIASIYINSCSSETEPSNATKDEKYTNNSEIIMDANVLEPLKLNDGYELAVKSVDIDGNKAYVELSKDGQIVAGKVIIPANEADGAFVYSKPGTSQLIIVHIRNVFRGSDANLATVDSVLQTSETEPSVVLINSSRLSTIGSGTYLDLDEGYKLAIKSVDIDGNKAYLELSKDGEAVDGKVVIAANEADDVFVYTKPGTSQLIKVHIKNAFRGADSNLVTIDGVLQTSETDPSFVLINNSDMLTLSSGTHLKLNEDYELGIRSVDIDGNKVYLELTKGGQLIESRVIVAANGVDDTLVYTRIEGAKSITSHFKNAFRGAEASLVTVDGIFQG
jgi:hypothetical protein